MRKTSSFCVLLLMSMTVFSTYAQANYTIRPSDADLFDLEHRYFYVWKEAPSIPTSETLTQVSILFKGINDWRIEPDDKMYIRLLSKAEIDAAVAAENMSNVSGSADIYRGTDYEAVGDALNEYGQLLTVYEDKNEYSQTYQYQNSKGKWITVTEWVNPPEDFIYTFSQAQVDLLNSYLAKDGVFGIGLDSDCLYSNGSPELECTTKIVCTTVVIPAPGAILLGGIGVVLVGWLRRRRTL